MNLEQIRGQATEELIQAAKDARESMFKLKFALHTESVENTREIRGLRKRIARMKTVIRERELAAAKSGETKES